MVKIFIDGEHGTTGLQIRDRLTKRTDIDLLSLPHDKRRDRALRTDYLRAADIAILCLPDDASREAIEWIGASPTRVIDSSTAFRTHPDWIYGFAEMTKGQKERIAATRWLANPGCYPTGSLALLRPLREAEIIDADYPLSINAVSGYSGGGKQLIAQMEDATREDAIHAHHFLYGLGLKHKHLAEIRHHGLLAHAPIFTPSVGRFAQGMIVNIPLHQRLFAKKAGLKDIHAILSAHYEGEIHVMVSPLDETRDMAHIDAQSLAGTDDMRLHVCGDETTGLFNLVAVLDNLGKGAAGAAVQNLDIMLGVA